MLVNKLTKWQGVERQSLIATLVEGACSMLHVNALTPDVLKTLESLVDLRGADLKSLVALIQRELKLRKDDLSPESIARLTALLQGIEGSDFPSRLRRYVSYATFEDSYDDQNRDSRVLDDKLETLATEAVANSILLHH